MFGFPVKVSWPNIASLPRNVSSSSQQIPSELSDFPIPIAFSRHWGGVTPPRPPLFTCLSRGEEDQLNYDSDCTEHLLLGKIVHSLVGLQILSVKE